MKKPNKKLFSDEFIKSLNSKDDSIKLIDLKKQFAHIYPSVMRNINAVLAHGRYIMGPEIEKLEKKLAAYVRVKHCITVASGTDALLIAMMALGIGHGDEVITTPFTFIATAEMIAFLGAKPVFVDIDPCTYNIDHCLIEKAITPKTKAIMPVSLFGQCADMDVINKIADHYGIPVIEDAAQSFGATYKGKRSCALSTIGCTSFFPSKSLGCYGDGGACFTDDDTLAKYMREIRMHGQDRRYHHQVIGINGRMDTIQAAVLLAKFEIFKDEVKKRARIGKLYTKLLIGRVKTPLIMEYNKSVYAQYTIETENRDALTARLKGKGIPTAVHYPVPLHLQPAFSYLGQGVGCFPEAEAAARRILSLPMHPYLNDEEIKYICDVVSKNTNA